jgi:hypothetical protein
VYQFQPDCDSGVYALAKRHAESYESDDIEDKVKGNLGEIAFHEFCRYTLSPEKWHWHNGQAIRRGEREYNKHDFTVLGKTVDIKARSSLDQLFSIEAGDTNSDVVVFAWIPPSVTESVMDASKIIDLKDVHPMQHDPVVVLGSVSQNRLTPSEIPLKRPGTTAPTIRHLPMDNVEGTVERGDLFDTPRN